MSLSMKFLIAVSVSVGLFETVGVLEAVSTASGGRDGGLVAALVTAFFAAVFLGCAWALWRRQSLIATVVVGLFLLVDVAGVPFYRKEGWQDWAIQLGFAGVGAIGVLACGDVLRMRRRGGTAARTYPTRS